MNKKILPLGSVVTLLNGDGSLLMVVSRASIVVEQENECYYDYGAVLIPQGMVTPEHVFFFNKENVKDVLFRGFENKEELDFAEKYDEMLLNSTISKGKV